MSTTSRLRAFKERDCALNDYAIQFEAAFGSKRKPRALLDLTIEEQGAKGSTLNNAYKAFKKADEDWRENIR
jgi:hypothetical protein